MKALVIGAAGLLGYSLVRDWSARPGWTVVPADLWRPRPDWRELDILNSAALRSALVETAPDLVVLAAANPHVDGCEADPRGTRRLNVEATLEVARLSRQAGARFIFFSSDYVFDGARGGYLEEDEPRPACEYGRQKLEVERGLASLGERSLVVRVSALFGWELKPRNYILQVLSSLREGRPVRAASDQDYNATYAESLAGALARLVEKKAWGVLHLAGSQTLTRLELARAAAEAFGLDGSMIEGAPLRELVGAGRAPRPLHSALDSSKAGRLFGAEVCGAREGLARMRRAQAEWENSVSTSMGEDKR